MVHPNGTPPAVLFHKRTVNKRLSRALRQSPVAASYLDTCETELASHTLRNEVASRINDEVPVVGHTLANRDVLHPLAWGNAIIGGIVGTFCGAIDINNLDMVAENTVHLLATTRRETDRQVVEGVEQQAGHCCRVTSARNLVVEEELADGSEVLANFCRHDVE